MRRLAAVAGALTLVALAAGDAHAKGKGWGKARPGVLSSAFEIAGLFAPDAVLIFVVGLPGQSNDTGTNSESSTPVTGIASATDFTWCQGGASNLADPMRENHSSNCWPDAETPISAVGDAIRARIPDHAGPIFGVRCAVAGTSITTFWDSGGGGAQSNYTACLAQISAIISEVDSDPGTYGAPATPTYAILGSVSAQGEADEAMSAAAYAGHLTPMLDAFDAAALSATGQIFDPVHVYEQVSTWAVAGSETTPQGPTLAQIAVCDARANAHCIGGTYAHDGESSGSGLHKAPANHRLSGEIRGAALAAAIFGGGYADAPRISSVNVDELTLEVCWDQPIETDTSVNSVALGARTDGGTANYGCAAHPNGSLGIEITSDGTPPTLSSCTQTSENCRACTLSAELTEADRPVVRVAWTAGGTATGAFGCQNDTDNPHSNIRSPSTLMYAQHDLCERVPDGGVPCVTVRDGGVVPDSGPSDSGVTPDSGVDNRRIYVFHILDASWLSPFSVYGGPSVLAALGCDTGGGFCSYFYDPVVGEAREAREAPDAGTGTYQVPLAQRIAEALGGDNPVVLVGRSFPGTRMDAMNTTDLVAWDDLVVAEALAAYPNGQVWPAGLLALGGGYACSGDTGPPSFASCWSDPVATFEGQLETSAASFANLDPTWTTADYDVLFTKGSFHGFQSVDNTYIPHPYEADFDGYADANHHPCGALGGMSVGVDGLHPDATGAFWIADVLAQCVERYVAGRTYQELELTAVAWQDTTTLRATFNVPCRETSDCEDDPPLRVETTAITTQTTQGDVDTYGLHFLMAGVVQTPGAAITSASCSAAAACTGVSCYCDLTFASDPGLTHDEVGITTHAEGGCGGATCAGGGATNLRADRNLAWTIGTVGGGDWAAPYTVSANSRDGGVAADAGPDAGPDGGVADGGVHPEIEGRNWTISWTNANCTDTGSGDGVDDSEGVMHLDEDGTFNDLECDFDLASLGFSATGLYNHTLGFGLGTNGVTGGCLENTSNFPGVADEEPFVSRVVYLETNAQSTNRYHNWYQIDGNNLFQVVHNAARVNTGIVRVGGTSITEAFTGGATLNAGHVLDVAHDPNGLWGPANTVYVCRDGVCESTSGADHGAIAGGSPFGFGGPFNCSAGIEDMYYAHGGLYIGATDAAEWSPSQHVVGALRWETGGWASTYSLDPASGNLSTAVTGGALDVLDEFTVLIWADASTLYLPAMSRWGGGGASTEQWWVGIIEGNGDNAVAHYEIGFEQGGQGRVCDGAASGWQQIGFVYDGSTTSLDCYEDGALSNNALNGTIPASLNDEDQDLQLGSAGGDDVDSFSYFNCALTAAEVLRVYCATHGAGAGACATAGPGSSSVDETDFDTYVLDHACFVEHCDFERNGGCFGGTAFTGGSAAYTTAQP